MVCLSDDEAYHHFDYKGVDCFTIKAPKLGPARVIAYDMMAINYALKLVKNQKIDQPIFYILGEYNWSFYRTFCSKNSSCWWCLVYQSLMDLNGNELMVQVRSKLP